MPTFRIVLVEPEYEINVGAIARLMANFAQGDLAIVNPKCEIGFTAKMHAKHAAHLLEGARICKSLDEAANGCSLTVGTSGVLRRHKKLLRNPITPEELLERLAKSKKSGTIALVFGREGIGLTADDLQRCDLLCTIPTSGKYPVMNLSHAVAVMLYALCAKGRKLPEQKRPASEGESAALSRAFDALVERQSTGLRNVPKTKLAFRTVVGRGMPSEVELRCMLGVLHSTLRELEGGKKKLAERKR